MPQESAPAKLAENDITLIHAPAGAGKTYVAGSASAYFEVRPPDQRKNLITLEDMFWIQFDRGGLQTLHSLGVDPYYYDFSARPMDGAAWIVAVADKLTKELPGLLQKRNSKILVVDTVSAMSDYLNLYFLSGTKNAQLGYGRAQAAFFQLLWMLQAIKLPQVWLCHSQSAFVADTDPTAAQRNVQHKATRAFDYQIDLDLVRKVADKMRSIPNLVTFVTADAQNKKRYFELKEGGDAYVKNRYGSLLPDRMEANLQVLWAKIAEAEAAMLPAK